MIRVSVTTIESFRRVMSMDYAQESELIAQVQGEFTPTWQMDAGSAWDAVISKSRAGMCHQKTNRGNCFVLESEAERVRDAINSKDNGLVDCFRCFECGCWHIGKPGYIYGPMGYHFHDYDVAKAKELLGHGLTQVKHTMNVDTEFGEATVVGVADHIHGSVIQDNKAKFSTPDPRDYEASLQWRFYLEIFGASVFRYNLFDFRDPKDGYCELKSILCFNFWPYQGMRADCVGWLNHFLEWANRRGLMGFLGTRRKETNGAAA